MNKTFGLKSQQSMLHTQTILDFLAEIGLPVHESSQSDPAFLPGIAIKRGELMIDRERLAHPGDLLHEAGHIAITAPSERHLLTGDLESGAGEEMAAIAWSYAAVVHLGLAPSILFYEEGYKGDSLSLIAAFESGGGIGVPLLEWYGMTRYQRDDLDWPNYPKMHRWIRDTEIESND